ncbi:hypothetical protein [Ferrigenium kumadai]|nr:hypothetical protein [Ferrigenium kumadai]
MKMTKPIQIIGDGALAMPDIGDGRLIPVLIIDCDSRRDLYDVVMAHEDMPPGDVTVTWGRKLLSKKSVYLIIDFKKPVETQAVIEFDIAKFGGIADLIINARAFYFQPNDSGNRVVTGLDKPKILVEVPYEAKLDDWDSILHNFLVKRFRKQGANKQEANTAAKAHLDRLRNMGMRGSSYSEEELTGAASQ